MSGLGARLSHERGGADDAVESSVIDHLDDGAHSSSLLPDPHCPSVLQLDLRGCIRPVAELVLETLDVECVARAVRQDARQQTAREPARRLRKDEKCVTHRRGAKPLLAREQVLAVDTSWYRTRCVAADVGAALPFG